MKKISNTPFYKSELVLAASFLMIMLIFMIFGGGYFWREIWFVFEIFVLTFLTRTVLFRTSVSTFLKGLYLGCLLTLVFNGLIAWIYPEREKSVFFNGFVVGFSEEFFKFLPVVFTAFLLRRRLKISLNPSDWVWLAVLSGAAFSMAEKVLYQGISFPFTYGPHLGSFPFFSDALGIHTPGGDLGYIGHAAATGFIGLTVALGLKIKEKSPAAKQLWWLLPVFGYSWVSVEHALNNAYYASHSEFWTRLGGGKITPALFLMALAVVLCWDLFNLISYLKKKPLVRDEFKKRPKRIFKLFQQSPWKGLQGLWVLVVSWRLVNLLSSRKDG